MIKHTIGFSCEFPSSLQYLDYCTSQICGIEKNKAQKAERRKVYLTVRLQYLSTLRLI